MDEPADWPKGARPIYEAVFSHRFDPAERRELGRRLAPHGQASELAGERPDGERFLFEEAVVDFEKCEFRYTWASADQPDRKTGFSMWPGHLRRGDLQIIQDAPSPASEEIKWGVEWEAGLTLDRKGLVGLRIGMYFVWAAMVDELQKRVAAGDARLYARQGSPLAPINAIAPDSWPHFGVEKWRDGVFHCALTDERLFSVRVCEVHGARPVVGRRRGTEADLSEFLALSAQRADAGDPMTLPEAEVWARTRGLPRTFAREARALLPAPLKLQRGEKKQDRLGK